MKRCLIFAAWCSMGFKITLSPGAYLGAALLVLLLPVNWWTGAVLAAAGHELSHMAAIYATGGKVYGISVGPGGARMDTMAATRGREVITAAAGPLGSLVFAVLCRGFPEAAVCAVIQGLYNLLPVYPLDGGRILRGFLPDPICAGIGAFTRIMLLGLGLWGAVNLHLDLLPLIPGCALAFRTRK